MFQFVKGLVIGIGIILVFKSLGDAMDSSNNGRCNGCSRDCQYCDYYGEQERYRERQDELFEDSYGNDCML